MKTIICPDALFVRPIPGRQAHLDPSEIPPQDRDIHHKGFWGGGLLGARRRRTGEGESGRPGVWRATLQIPIISVSGSLLGWLCVV
eukprot:1161841-Pelagomonas_calceolata.AAC.2